MAIKTCDKNSKEGMDPSYWGPAGWRILHRLAYTFQDREDARRFYTSALQTLLPCPRCRYNFQQHVDATPFPRSVVGVGKWVYNVHHRVNEGKGGAALKEEPSYAAARRMYRGVAFDEMEWVFVDALVRMHPGKLKASESYLADLRLFLQVWTRQSGFPMPGDVACKSRLRAWIASCRKTKGCNNQAIMACSSQGTSCAMPPS